MCFTYLLWGAMADQKNISIDTIVLFANFEGFGINIIPATEFRTVQLSWGDHVCIACLPVQVDANCTTREEWEQLINWTEARSWGPQSKRGKIRPEGKNGVLADSGKFCGWVVRSRAREVVRHGLSVELDNDIRATFQPNRWRVTRIDNLNLPNKFFTLFEFSEQVKLGSKNIWPEFAFKAEPILAENFMCDPISFLAFAQQQTSDAGVHKNYQYTDDFNNWFPLGKPWEAIMLFAAGAWGLGYGWIRF